MWALWSLVLLEFCVRSNKAGLFVEIVLYHGGARRGCVMTPTSSKRSGWSLFWKELCRFLSAEKPLLLQGVTSANAGGFGPSAGGGQNGKNALHYGNQWKLRNFEKPGVIELFWDKT